MHFFGLVFVVDDNVLFISECVCVVLQIISLKNVRCSPTKRSCNAQNFYKENFKVDGNERKINTLKGRRQKNFLFVFHADMEFLRVNFCHLSTTFFFIIVIKKTEDQ